MRFFSGTLRKGLKRCDGTLAGTFFLLAGSGGRKVFPVLFRRGAGRALAHGTRSGYSFLPPAHMPRRRFGAKVPLFFSDEVFMATVHVRYLRDAATLYGDGLSYATSGSAGMDLRANVDAPIVLGPLERALVPTGLYIALPPGFEAQVRPRSGLALKKGIGLLNAPGTIDADYRGEIGVILVNLSAEPFTVADGDRIAQLVVARHERVMWQPVETLDETERGAGGFGHTGQL